MVLGVTKLERRVNFLDLPRPLNRPYLETEH